MESNRADIAPLEWNDQPGMFVQFCPGAALGKAALADGVGAMLLATDDAEIPGEAPVGGAERLHAMHDARMTTNRRFTAADLSLSAAGLGARELPRAPEGRW